MGLVRGQQDQLRAVFNRVDGHRVVAARCDALVRGQASGHSPQPNIRFSW
jgi:hypothetical protein